MNAFYRLGPLRLVSLLFMLIAPLSVAQVNSSSPVLPVAPTAAVAVDGTNAIIAPPEFLNDRIVLTAEQSVGGKIMRQPDGKLIGTALDKSCRANFKYVEDANIDWKLTTPLPAGWWHGCVKSNLRPGYANRDIEIMLMSDNKPAVAVGPNYINYATGRVFEFWIYSSTPVKGVRMHPTADLWMWNDTWPISEITLEHRVPTELTAADAVTMDLPAGPNGTIPLPMALPTGNWIMKGVTATEGVATLEGEDGRTVQAPFRIDKWKTATARGANFFMDSPIRKLTFTNNLFKSVLLRHNISHAFHSIATDDRLIVTVDPSKTESGQLVMIGSNLTGEAPTFSLLPRGLRNAVLTSWDDGTATDLRCAEILNKHGYHPSFFLNSNAPALKFMDKLEALNVEVGAHGYTHAFLYLSPPQSALEVCVEGRKFLEKALQHPVISFGYPNGYIPAYDADGDYVLRAVKAAGYWSGRTTYGGEGNVETYGDLTHMDTDGFFVYSKNLEAAWAKAQAKEGSVFYFWGHSWQIGQTDEQWKKFEDFVAQFGNQPNTWYASQGELSLWLWARKTVQIAVENKSPDKVVVKLSRPWLHPYLAAKCPLTLIVPAGVEKVVWHGKDLPVSNARVELPWAD